MIERELYQTIIKSIPIFCVDIVIKYNQRYLLVKRTNEPLKGAWYVVGGRVNHGELALLAAKRKIKEELGITISETLKFKGYYEDFFGLNSFESDVLYHTFSAVFECEFINKYEIKLDNQASAWQWDSTLPHRFIENSVLFD